MRVAMPFTVTVTVRASRVSLVATARIIGMSPTPEPGAISTHDASLLAVHAQPDGVPTANASRPPVADTLDGRPLTVIVQVALGADPGDGDGDGDGEGDGAGAGAAWLDVGPVTLPV